MRKGLLSLLLFALVASGAAPARAAVAPGADRVVSLPTLGPVSEPLFAGYASAGPSPCADLACSDRPGLFYGLAGRDGAADYRDEPTVLWSNGGPGASSFYGFLTENGPYALNPADQLRPYPGSWTSVANYLFFDHPLGVGMSFPFEGAIAKSPQQGTRQLANALEHVVDRDGLENSPMFLTGESYGGTYMPLLARRLLRTDSKVEIGGVVIVAGWVDPPRQVGTTARYALTHGLIDAAEKRRLDKVYARCRKLLDENGKALEAAEVCQSIQDKIAKWSGRYLANIAQSSDIDYDPTAAYLNRPDVRAALHAKSGGTFEFGSDPVYTNYADEVMRSRLGVVADLLEEGVPVMVISGLNDGKDTNVLAARKWISKLEWSGRERFSKARREQWKPSGPVLGYRREGGGLTTLDVLGAGHLAPRDEPQIASALEDFMTAAGAG